MPWKEHLKTLQTSMTAQKNESIQFFMHKNLKKFIFLFDQGR